MEGDIEGSDKTGEGSSRKDGAHPLPSAHLSHQGSDSQGIHYVNSQAQDQKQGRNEFVICLQPLEDMYMKLAVDQPRIEMSTAQSELDLSYTQRYQGFTIPKAYERLIRNVTKGLPSQRLTNVLFLTQ